LNVVAGARREGLGSWIVFPLALMVVAAAPLLLAPSLGYDEGSGAPDAVRLLYALFVLGAMLVSLLAGLGQLDEVPRGSFSRQALWCCAAAAAIGAAAGLFLFGESSGGILGMLFMAAVAASVAALVALLVALVSGRQPREVRPVLSAYLVGAGLAILPALGFVGFLLMSGSWE
jgi:hypothetical protein